MSSPVLRGALIGAAVGWVLYLLVTHLHWIIAVLVLLFALDRCAPDYQQVASKRALRDSFEHAKVTLTQVRGQTPANPYYRHVEAVSAVIHNRGKARIYDLRLRCAFTSRTAEGRAWVTSKYHYGYVMPSSSITVRLGVDGNGHLREADPASFQCEPTYEVEKSDLFKVRG
jgi:hypothetical protein